LHIKRKVNEGEKASMVASVPALGVINQPFPPIANLSQNLDCILASRDKSVAFTPEDGPQSHIPFRQLNENHH